MTLDTKVGGDPAALRSTATWLGDMSGRLDDSARLVHQAGTGSEGDWEGPASEGFRSTMAGIRPRITAVATGYDDVKGKLDAHASALSSVKQDMERAKKIARDAGLTVSGDMISAPTQPPSPQPLGEKPSQTERKSHQEAEAAVASYNRQAQAYKQAAEIVRSAREKEDESIEILRRGLNAISRNESGFTADLTSGLVGAGFGAYAGRAGRTASRYRDLQRRYEAKAAEARARYEGLRNQRISRFRLVRRLTNSVRQGTALATAESATQRAASHGATAGNYAAKAGRFARVGKTVPFIGTGIAIIGGVTDYTSGRESAAQAATSTLGGVAAGMAAGAAVGSVVPVGGTAVGAVVGAGVGLGVSMGIDASWGSISSGATSLGSALNPFD